jgi:hypothetical protein
VAFLRRSALHGCVAAASVFATLVPARAAAQAGTLSTAQIINLGATKNSSLTLTVVSGANQSLATINDGTTTNFPTPVQLQTSWDVNPGKTGSVTLVAYFTTPAQAMTSGAVNIPAAQIKGRVPTGAPTTFTAITQGPVTGGAASVGTAGGSLTLFSATITGVNKTATRTDNLFLQIDRTGQPGLPAATYTGTLYLRAITQ